MSKYLTFQEICFTSKDLLLLALKQAGYPHEQGDSLVLYGYHGDARPERAQIVVRRGHLSSSSNDIGFMLTPKGYVPIVSQFDQGVPLGPQREKFLPAVRTAYAQLVVAAVARRLGGTITAGESGGVKRMVVQYA